LLPTTNIEDQVSVFMPLSHRISQLCPKTPLSLFIPSYDLQGYGGDIKTYLHTGIELSINDRNIF
jgi:hypothetical protein